MNILELDSYNLADAVKFNEQLNPRIWQGNKMRPEVRAKLLEIAEDFKQSLGLTDLNVKDITLSGSNAGYTYTPHSDIDLHLVVDLPEADASDVYRELFDAKKFQYNETHNIKIGGYDVELYVENANKSAVSQGIFSVLNDDWINIPLRKRSTINDNVVKNKYDVIKNHIESAIESEDLQRLTDTAAKIKKMRQAGLDRNGELGPENLAYKMLRSQGVIKKLYDARTAAKDRELSLRERTIQVKKPFRYGFRTTEDVSSNPSGVSPETKMFLSEKPAPSQQEIVTDFVNYCVEQLGIEQQPTIKFKRDPEWSARNKTFGRYNHLANLLEVSLAGRHVMDILRTVAHELTHQRQHEVADVPDTAGETGSAWENEANAKAGVLMREYAQQHPEFFADAPLEESSGYIPTKKQANDPRFTMALTKDVRPGATGREANKLNLRTDGQGRPALLMKTANQMHENLVSDLRWEFALMETEILGEINMSPTNLRAEAAKTGAIAGMEFEMIVPNTETDVEPEYEPDYDQDRRARSFSDVRDFFHDGDYNGRRDADRLMEELAGEYEEWVQEQTAEQWNRDGVDYMRDFVEVNDLFDRDEALDQARDEVITANPDLPPESEDFQKLVSARIDELQEQFVLEAFEDQGRIYNDAFETFSDEQRDEYDERSFLDDKYQTMSDIQSAFDISWPHYYDINDGQDGDMDIDQVADEFSSYMGKPVNASRSYHGGKREAGTYVVEPDGSLEGDNPGDGGLEFVSPPMPIDEMISDLNKVKTWAGKTGCYTNDSTGLHINISVPDYSLEKLDYVKLALLMGDEYVLELFGRSGNTYAKSATGKIKGMLQKNPDIAPQVMDKMREHMEGLATKAIHSGTTDKYTSINTKSGYIEFRSPGGDWLDENFDKIENTLLRFTVALSAAIDPQAYRQEYLKKLYKLLASSQEKGGVDVVQLFSNYSAGELDKAALIRQVREKQLARNIDKGRTTPGQKFWWKVTNPANTMASIEVVAANKEQAIANAILPGNYPDWARVQNTLRATPLRPYQAPEAKPEQKGNWGIWIGPSNRFAREPNTIVADNVLRRFPSQAAAMAFLEQNREGNPRMRTDIEVREIPANYELPTAPVGTPVNRNTLAPTGPGPWEVFRISDGSSIAELGQTSRLAAEVEARRVIDQRREDPELYGVRTRQPAAQAPQTLTRPGQGQQTFTGEWKVVDPEGREIYRFSGVGNNQGDANRVAMDWLRQNPRRMQAGVEVLPIMG